MYNQIIPVRQVNVISNKTSNKSTNYFPSPNLEYNLNYLNLPKPKLWMITYYIILEPMTMTMT